MAQIIGTVNGKIEQDLESSNKVWHEEVQQEKTERQQAFNLQVPDNLVARQDKDGLYSILEASEFTMQKYGVLQEVVIQSSDEDMYLKALRILDDDGLPKENITVD